MIVEISVEVAEDDEWADPEHDTGITTDAYDRLTGRTVHGPSSLGWLGEVQDVKKAE